jgi:hypothetical protein
MASLAIPSQSPLAKTTFGTASLAMNFQFDNRKIRFRRWSQELFKMHDVQFRQLTSKTDPDRK